MTTTSDLKLKVLASGSAGNCALLTIGTGHRTRAALIDAGLSPRRTRRLLAEAGIRPDQLDHILITHFDTDHCHRGWANADLGPARVRYHIAHHTLASRLVRRPSHQRPFDDDPFELDRTPDGKITVTPIRLAHDDEGVTAFRIDTPTASLAYATDLGRATTQLINTCKGVGTLAIESNYCPNLQLESDRPAFLKDRIMNGRGHISNQQAADAARRINPTNRLVLLHLSRQCNTPDLARQAHAPLGLPITITDQVEPTDWITVAPARSPAQPLLFSATE
ncbi:MAG: MBL fold metallo-hydrolase [Planctomycetota bacterium]